MDVDYRLRHNDLLANIVHRWRFYDHDHDDGAIVMMGAIVMIKFTTISHDVVVLTIVM